jgi:hypothetical protein
VIALLSKFSALPELYIHPVLVREVNRDSRLFVR